MRKSAFLIAGIAPALDGITPTLVPAIARAGGIGLLDVSYSSSPADATGQLIDVMALTDGTIGVRATKDIDAVCAVLSTVFGKRRGWLVTDVAGYLRDSESIAGLRAAGRCSVIVEIADESQLDALAAVPPDGLIVRGQDAGGWSMDDTSFILFQKIIRRTELPVYVHGAAGINGAAACCAGGAQGVVLEDQLYLMRESHLPAAWQDLLTHTSGHETRHISAAGALGFRTLQRPGLQGGDVLANLAEDAIRGEKGEHGWQQSAMDCIGWGDPTKYAWPIGQGIGLARGYRDSYRATGRLLTAIKSACLTNIETAARLQPLAPNAPLAASHGTRFPVVQGPMTRVSDVPTFAAAVAEGGGLPFIALAMMRGEAARKTLQETSATLGKAPWGVGLLGFVPQQLREEQTEAILEAAPGYAIIAGGRPDQAARFEARGIAAYLHVPSRSLLAMFIEDGAKRFVFEGRECGGHIGPLASFALWETMIEELLVKVPDGQADQYHVLFAGGIADARAAAMVAAMAAPLAEKGIRIGVLMGTAYLFSQEIVATGATVPGYQAAAIACTTTASLTTGPGHSTRCARTPFAEEFLSARERLIRAGASHEELRDQLEELNLGRLRVASKGLDRNSGGEIVSVDEQGQQSSGMFMLGQVAALRDRPATIAELHRDVTVGATRLLGDYVASLETTQTESAPTDIAIVGIGNLLPGADHPEQFWKNIVSKTSAIREIPAERWDWRLYFDEDQKAKDKIYSRWGGFLDEVEFDPVKFGIPPNSLKAIDPMQLLTLEVVRRALSDAGYEDAAFDRENTSVILGASGGLGDLGLQYGVRAEMSRFVDAPDDAAWDRLPEWTEESFAGTLPNVSAGRVANRFDFGGLNFTVDAACASSLTAVYVAVNELVSGRANVALAGGIDTVQSPFGYMCFSKTRALSRKGRACTFDKDGDGIVISEGLAVVCLKRLADAERDGDRIYGVIKSVAGSSDGKALGLTAPRPDGQIRALSRAYQRAGLSPGTLGLIEAHGTGTPVGDRAETESVIRSLQDVDTPPRQCALGSVKTLIGHTKACAGVAGLIKTALALHHKVLPPHCNVDSPIDPIEDPDSPVYLLQDARPWLRQNGVPRRAGVSAFGFGGTNFHAVLEEYDGHLVSGTQALGADDWPTDICLFTAPTSDAMVKQISEVQALCSSGAKFRLRDLAFTLAGRVAPGTGLTLALIASDTASLQRLLEQAQKVVAGSQENLVSPQLVFARKPLTGSIAWLFPGQGAQSPNMMRETALYIADVREAVEAADQQLAQDWPVPLSRKIFPPGAYTDAVREEQRKVLSATSVAQPAIGALSAGLASFARRIGIPCDMMAGHSFGEYTALYAAGVMERADLFHLAAVRGQVMEDACRASAAGGMVAVRAPRAQVAEQISGLPELCIANHNSPQQTVVSGPATQLTRLEQMLSEQKTDFTRLPVGGAFHHPMFAGAAGGLEASIRGTKLATPGVPVYANADGSEYPADADAISRQLQSHMLSPVEYVSQIEKMYEQGARVFLELGPGSILSGLTSQILGDRPHTSVSFGAADGRLDSLFSCMAVACATGATLDLNQLYADRHCVALDIAKLTAEGAPKPGATSWFVSGGCARPQTDDVQRTGILPQLTADTKGASIRVAASAPTAPAVAATPTAIPAQQHVPPATPAQQPEAMPGSISGTAVGSQEQVAAVTAYQETMQQFLRLQESVVQQFFGDGRQLTQPPAIAGSPVSGNGGLAPAMTTGQMPADVAPISVEPVVTGVPANGTSPDVDNTADNVSAAVEVSPAPATGVLSGDKLRVSLTETLVGLVADRTGYPAEMLGMEQDMEAELGIDSIKRVEIIGAFRQAVPETVSEIIQASMDQLTKARSLDEIISLVCAGHQDDAVIPETVKDNENVADATIAASLPAAEPVQTTAVSIDYLATLTALVCERTGYPEDMINPDQDLEADLGIDSIKRVEILGAFRQQLPEVQANYMQSIMDQMTGARSLSGMCELMAELDTGSTPDSPQAQDDVSSAAAVVAEPAFDATALLVQTVCDRTGYPADMIGLQQDMEADLGIDSIKRVEIIGAFQKGLPDATASFVREHMDSFTSARSLEALLQLLPAGGASLPEQVAGSGSQNTPSKPDRAQTPSPQAAAAPQTADKHSVAPGGNNAALPRLIFKGQEVPVNTDGKTVKLCGTFIVTGDPGGLAIEVAATLEQLGATVVLLSRDLLADTGALERTLASIDRKHDMVNGVIHLAALENGELPSSLAEWRRMCRVHCYSLFHILHYFADSLSKAGERGDGWLFAASCIDGSYGRTGNQHKGQPGGGAALGMLKTAAAEWPGVQVRLIDFDGLPDVREITGRVHAEFCTSDSVIESGCAGNKRLEFVPELEPLRPAAQPALQADSDWVVLVTAGARGITAVVANELVVPGITFVLVGRSAMPGDEEEETRGCDDMAVLRDLFMQRARKEGRLHTPVSIDREVNGLLGQREIRRNLEGFRQKGVKVEYISADVRDESAFGNLITETYERHGRIDAVLHGAGIIEDRLLRDKPADSFARVFDSKVDSTFILARHLSLASLKLIVFFTSVAGRFGNHGQADYAAANEVVNRFAWRLHADNPALRTIAVNWGPWDRAGMASESVRRQFRERGIVPISFTEGRRYFAEEIRNGDAAQVETVAGEGPWLAMGRNPQQIQGSAADTVAVDQATDSVWRFVDQPLHMEPNGSVTLNHRFSADTDPYLIDHSMDGSMVLPATCAAEWFAQFVQIGWPDWRVCRLTDLRVCRGLKIPAGQTGDVVFRGRASSHAAADELKVSVELAGADGAVYYKGVVEMAGRVPESMSADLPVLVDADVVSSESAYADYLFHGKCFQLLSGSLQVGQAGADSPVEPSAGTPWQGRGDDVPGQGWLFDPGLLDTAPQLAIVWARHVLGTTCLPSRIGVVERFGTGPITGPIRLQLRLQADTSPDLVRYDAFFVDAQGLVRLRLGDVESAASTALNRLGVTGA